MAHVYLNGEYQKSVWREDTEREVALPGEGDARISILVENLGHCNFGEKMSEHKGLLGPLTHVYRKNGYLCAKPMLMEYRTYSMPLSSLPTRYEDKPKAGAPAFYRYRFYVNEVCDTCLHPHGFTRGVAFVNGFNLGRHWDIEPSPNKLYVPAPLLKKGWNEIVVFDVLTTDGEKRVYLGE
jgi:beta-galactosidase